MLVRRGAFTCAEWQVTLCAPIRQVTLRSSEMSVPLRAVSPSLTFQKLFKRYSFWKPISTLYGALPAIGSHNIYTCHQTQIGINAPRLNLNCQTDWYSIYLPRMNERLSWPRICVKRICRLFILGVIRAIWVN